MKKSSHTPLRRMICIDQWIREKKYPNGKALAKELEVDRKTIQRDIDYMRDQLGAPMHFDAKHKGYYYTEEDFYLPMVHLREKDIFAFVVAEKILKQYETAPYYKEVKSALDKIAAFLPDTLSFKDAAALFEFELTQVSAVDEEKLSLLQSAAQKKQRVQIQYYAFSKQEKTVRDIDPYHLLNHRGDWYCVGYCHIRNDVRLFALSRILMLQPTDKQFEIPKSFRLDAFLRDSFELTREPKQVKVKIKFSPYQAQWIREKVWHHSQQLDDQPDGSTILTMTVQGINDVKRWVMKYGAEAEVLAPKELRDAVTQELEKMSSIYQLHLYNLKSL